MTNEIPCTAPNRDMAKVMIAGRPEHEKNDCVVRAFVIATGKPYPVIHALFKKHGRKDRRGTWRRTSTAVAKELGMRWVNESCTARTFLKDMIFARSVVAFKRGHAFAVSKGMVVDVYDCVKPRSRVTGYFTL